VTVASCVFNNDMLNAFSVIVLITMTCGYLIHLLERKNLHLGTLSRGAYWSIMAILQNCDNQPARKKARILMVLMMFANILGMQARCPSRSRASQKNADARAAIAARLLAPSLVQS